MRSEARQTLIHFLAKIASLEILFGGPLVVSDDLRPLIGAAAAVTVAVVPVALFYVGADALADAETGHLRRTALRLGVLGVWLVAPMNAYAIARLLQGDARFGAITLFGVVTCSLVILAYLFLVRRAFRSARLAFDTRALEDFGGPIE